MYEYITYSELRTETQDFFNDIVSHVSQAPTAVVVHNDPDDQRVRFLTQPVQGELPLGGYIIADVESYDPN